MRKGIVALLLSFILMAFASMLFLDMGHASEYNPHLCPISIIMGDCVGDTNDHTVFAYHVDSVQGALASILPLLGVGVVIAVLIMRWRVAQIPCPDVIIIAVRRYLRWLKDSVYTSLVESARWLALQNKRAVDDQSGRALLVG